MKVLVDVPQHPSEVSVPGQQLSSELFLGHTAVIQRMGGMEALELTSERFELGYMLS